MYVKDLSMQRVGNVAECERVMATGWQNRTVGATLMNADSSRSHSIFTIYLEACDTGECAIDACFCRGNETVCIGFHDVDIAHQTNVCVGLRVLLWRKC